MSDEPLRFEDVPAEHRARADDLTRLLAWGVHVAGSVSPQYCDAVLDGCRAALAADPALAPLVLHVRGVADRETTREFTAHGPTTKARLWAGLSDRLHDLTGPDDAR